MSCIKFLSVAITFAFVGTFGVCPCLAQEAVAQETAAQAILQPVTPVEKMESSSQPVNLTVELTTGNTISGTLVEADVVNIKTVFGEAAIPLSQIAGLRFATREDVTTTVVMINGDSITGATDVKLISIETDWGTAKINGSAIQSLLSIPNLKWQVSSGVSGKRWALVDSKAPESPAQVVPQPSAASKQANVYSPAAPSQTLPASSLPAGTYYQNGVLYRSGSPNQE